MIYDTDRTAEQFPFPYVNKNGASRESLLADRRAAYRAVHAAMKAFQECAPNGRDYQTAPRGAYELARARYNAHFSSLDKLANEIRDEAEFLQR